MARRLVEAGARVVTLNFGRWDFHSKIYDAKSGVNGHAPIFDQGLAALIQDLHDRGLDKDVAVVAWGEFGRTPKINKNGGRDHWPSGFSCVVGGGGIKGGLVIGETDPTGKEIEPTDPIEVNQLYATIFKTMGVDITQETITPIGRPMKFCDGKPIERLLV